MLQGRNSVHDLVSWCTRCTQKPNHPRPNLGHDASLPSCCNFDIFFKMLEKCYRDETRYMTLFPGVHVVRKSPTIHVQTLVTMPLCHHVVTLIFFSKCWRNVTGTKLGT